MLVVGDVMLDRYWFGDVSRISPEAPVPVVRIERTEERPGGAANVARNCAALGAQRRPAVGGRATTRRASALERLLQRSGVDARACTATAALDTTVKLRVIGRQQQLLRIDFETPPSHEVLASKLAEFERALAECDVVHPLRLRQGRADAHRADDPTARARAGKPVLVDPKGDDYSRYRARRVHHARTSPSCARSSARWKDEADLTSRAQPLRARARARGAAAHARRGGHDAVSERASVLHVPAEAREVFDVTGAGDTVIATLGGDARGRRRACTRRCASPTTPPASWSASSAPPSSIPTSCSLT